MEALFLRVFSSYNLQKKKKNASVAFAVQSEIDNNKQDEIQQAPRLL
jgi:hypothetical protein